MFPSYNPYNSFNALNSYSDYSGMGSLGSSYSGYGGYGGYSGLGGGMYGGLGGYGNSMGYGQYPMQNSNPIMNGFENYLMTSSRISNLIQMSMQAVSMTVQSAFQLAQSGMMLQQQHSSFNEISNPDDATPSATGSPKGSNEHRAGQSVGTTRATVEEITDDGKTITTIDHNRPNTTTTVGLPSFSTTSLTTTLDTAALHQDLSIMKLSGFMNKLFGFLDYLDSCLSILPTPPSFIRIFSISVIDTVINFTRRVSHLYNFSNSKNFNYTTIYSLYLQYRLHLRAKALVSNNTNPSHDKNGPLRRKIDIQGGDSPNDHHSIDRSILEDELFQLYEADDIRALVTHSLVARNYTELTRELIVEQYQVKTGSQSDHDNQPSLSPQPSRTISPIVSSLLAHHRGAYSIQSQQTTQNSNLQTAGYQLMQSTRPAKLWWFAGVLLFSVGVQATVSILRSLRDLLSFLFPSMFGSNRQRSALGANSAGNGLSQEELYHRWKLNSPHFQENGINGAQMGTLPAEFAEIHQATTKPKSMDELWGEFGSAGVEIAAPRVPALSPHSFVPQSAMSQSHIGSNGIGADMGTHMNGGLPTGAGAGAGAGVSGQMSGQLGQQMSSPSLPGFDPLDPYSQSNPNQFLNSYAGTNGLNGVGNQYGINGALNQQQQHQLYQQQQQQQLELLQQQQSRSWTQTLSTLITGSLICGTGWIVYKAFVIANEEMKKYQAIQKQQQEQQEQQRRAAATLSPNNPNNSTNPATTAAATTTSGTNQSMPLYSVDNGNGMMGAGFGNRLGYQNNGFMSNLGSMGTMGGLGGYGMGMNSMGMGGMGMGGMGMGGMGMGMGNGFY